MDGGLASRIEAAAAIAASLALAGALGFAAYAVSARLPVAAFFMLAGFALGRVALVWISRRPRTFPTPFIDLGAYRVVPDEVRPPQEVLDLTEIHAEPLELDDVLERIGPGARVIRLFDPQAMPTPGQLRDRIDRHLGRSDRQSPDASEALIEALTQLRQSLR